MKKISLFIFFVILVSIAIGGLLFLTTGSFSFITEDKPATEATNEKNINLNNTDEIYIRTSSGNIGIN